MTDEEKTKAIQRIDNRIAELLKEDNSVGRISEDNLHPTEVGDRNKSSVGKFNKRIIDKQIFARNFAQFISDENNIDQLSEMSFASWVCKACGVEWNGRDSSYCFCLLENEGKVKRSDGC